MIYKKTTKEFFYSFTMETKVWCEQVYVKTSSFSSPGNLFDGAFANNPIKSGELVEKGLMRRLSDNKNRGFNGMENQFIS